MNEEESLGELLIQASTEGDTAEVRTLLEEGANVNFRDVLGWTSLMLAVAAGHILTVGVLVEAGADLSASAQGQTALMLADNHNHLEIADLLK